MKPDDDNGDLGRPDYRVYRSRRRILPRFGGRKLGSPSGGKPPRKRPSRRRQGLKGQSRRDLNDRRAGGEPIPPGRRGPSGRKILKWVIVGALGWALLSLLAFGVSAQIQALKLDGDARSALQGNPWLLPQAQNILVIGTDGRSPDTLEPGAAQEKRCYEEQASGSAPSSGCAGARADTLMVVRAGGGKFNKLSIPRDSYADIPGQGSQKINAAYAYGGAELQIETVSGFLGIPIDHVVILNFDGFEAFIDAIGGVAVEVPERLCADISGGEANGGWTIDLEKGENTLNGEDALAYARTRKPSPCPGTAPSAYSTGYDDLDRAAAQQSIMNGIKNRITSPLRLPYNFVKGPIIGWTAPQAFISDMGLIEMPQLALSSIFAGSPKPDVLVPSGPGPDGSLEISVEERQRAVAALQG
jgi:LCP family protein required for cell wall assembly